MGARSLFSLFSSKESVLLLFFLEEKKQKKINCGAAFLLCSCRFRQRAAQNGRFTYEPSVFCSGQDTQESIYSQINQLPRSVFCFFSSRKEIVPLLFFLEEKKQKKVICRIGFCAFLYILRNPVAQNGRLTYEPAVFSFQAGCAGSRLLSEKPPQPLCLLFLFFKKRNRSLKEIVPPSLAHEKAGRSF